MKLYARVALKIPTFKIFHYLVPVELIDRIRVGQKVKVEFRNRFTSAYVIGFDENSDVTRVKPILEISEEVPLFDEKLISLAEKISNYYLEPLGKVLSAMLPGGMKKFSIPILEKQVVVPTFPRNDLKVILKSLKRRKQVEVLKVCFEFDRNPTVVEVAQKAGTSISPVKTLIKRGLLKLIREKRFYFPDFLEIQEKEPEKLSPEQKKALKFVLEKVKEQKFHTILLYGVTGSGKTEVYMQIIKHVLTLRRGIIMLVPEIALTPQTVARFKSRFGNLVAILHSRLTYKERLTEWERLRQGKAAIVVGARSAVFAPLKNVGLIIVDEEPEFSYKQEESPRYNAKKVAEFRMQIENGILLFGSATPSIETFYKAVNGQYSLLKLTKRVEQATFPEIEIVDMREELIKKRNRSIFSTRLIEELHLTLEQNKQAILFINRRGYSTFVLCRACGETIKCKNCLLSLKYHFNDNTLKCHYCGFTVSMPKTCPYCESSYIKYFGAGTQKVEQEIRKLFKNVKVFRMDSDTMTHKGAYTDVFKRLVEKKIDILVGTQMIAKGFHLPHVRLVGIIAADATMNLPDFRACERTYQLITQVAGRSGRSSSSGKVIIQTYNPEHYVINNAGEENYEIFFSQEIEIRKKLFFPPFSYLANIIVKGQTESKVEKCALEFFAILKEIVEQKKLENEIVILGPTQAALAKIKQYFRWQILLKAFEHGNLVAVLKEALVLYKPYKIKLVVDIDPVVLL